MAKPIKNAISSDYLKYKVDEDIVIYEGRFCVYLDRKYRCSGIIYYKMSYPISINFKGKILYVENNYDTHEEYNLDYDDSIIEIYGYKPIHITIDNINKNYIKGHINDNYIKSKNSYVDYIDFNIINLDNFSGDLIKYFDKVFAGRIEFDINDFHIVIDKRYDYRKELKDELKDKSGFIITHTGRIYKKDKRKFKTNNIISLIDKISYALSFMCGRYIGICSVKGYLNNKNTYRMWIENIITPYKFVPTWTDTLSNHNNIEKYMSLMLKKLEDRYLDASIKRVIDWYIESLGEITLENNIISIHIALETLSYVILVEQEKILTYEEFDKNKSSKNIRLLLSHCKVPYGHSELNIFDSDIKNRFDDGVELIIYYRNKIVHPMRKDDRVFLTIEDVWNIIQIGTRYVELILLYFIGYKGEYSNRLNERWFGEVELVPWNN